MIYTDHQLQVTTEAAGKFHAAVKELSQVPKDEITDIEQHENYIGALQRQAEKLEAEKAEYELIKSGKVEIKVSSIFDLGLNLVKARIKSGMDRETLSKNLKVSKDQIVSNEVNQYTVTTIDEIRSTAKILDVEIPNEVIPSHFNGKISGILSKLKKAGFGRKFVLSRMIHPRGLEKVAKLSGATLDKYTISLYKHLNHVFGWTWDQLTGSSLLPTPTADIAGEKFKVEPHHNLEKISVYSKYAHYLATVAAVAAKTLVKKDVPATATAMRKAIIASYGSINFENTLKYAWDCGVIVIPLNDKGSFHGVCIRKEYRNVIILNPKKLLMSTWLFDLLHELSHAGQDPDQKSFVKIEEVVTSHERRTSKEEIYANDFANAVIFGKNAIDLYNQCIKRSDGKLDLLKQAIRQVAQENNVLSDVLANYIAHEGKTKSKFEKKDLLALAQDFQMEEGNPYEIAIDIFFDRFPFTIDDGIDQDLLLQALEDL